MTTTQQTVLSVDGMTCPSCTRHVEGALRRLEGVKKVLVHLREGKAVVDHEQSAPSADAMIAALNDAGYSSQVA